MNEIWILQSRVSTCKLQFGNQHHITCVRTATHLVSPSPPFLALTFVEPRSELLWPSWLAAGKPVQSSVRPSINLGEMRIGEREEVGRAAINIQSATDCACAHYWAEETGAARVGENNTRAVMR